MKQKIAVVSLGDCRRAFYETRKHIAVEETEKLIEALGSYMRSMLRRRCFLSTRR